MPAQVLLNGLIVGFMYSLMAAGMSVTYSQQRFINLFHGGLYIISGYTFYQLTSRWNINSFVAIIVTLIFAVGIDRVVNQLFHVHIRGDNQKRAHGFVLSLALLLCVQNIYLFFYDAQTRTASLASKETLRIGSFTLTYQELLIAACVVLTFVGLYFLFFRTQLGLSMRAVSINARLCELRGINANAMVHVSSAIGALCAGAAGILILTQQNMEPSSGISLAVKAMAATIIGGMAVHGALYGGLILGVTENIAVWFAPSGYRDLVAFSIVAFFIIVRRGGLFVARTRMDH